MAAILRIFNFVLLASFVSTVVAAGDMEQANSYDNAWKAQWVSHCRNVLGAATGGSKTDGFVLQIGDSITNDPAYAQWARTGSGRTAEDTSLCSWARAAIFPSTGADTSNKNGFYLATAATSPGRRGMTSSRGITTREFLIGSGNGGTAMPVENDPTAAKAIIADGGTYTGNLRCETVVSAFNDAQIAVLLLGTNDVTAGISIPEFSMNLTQIIDLLEAKNVVVILSTVPPYYGNNDRAVAFNQEIRTIAQIKRLPLIDFYAEVLVRRSGITWNGTLMALDNVHPSSSGGGFTSGSDPYSNGGDPDSHRTGDACLNVGYLLRSWLTIQKLKEVREFVVNRVDPVPKVAYESFSYTVAESTGIVRVAVTIQYIPLTGAASVRCQSAEGTAKANIDYEGDDRIITFNGGVLRQEYEIVIDNDLLYENTEQFSLLMAEPLDCRIATPSAPTITINSDDSPPVISFAVANATVDEAAGNVRLSIMLDQPSGLPVTVPIATFDGSAHAGDDYASLSTSVDMPAGSICVDVDIEVHDDLTYREGLEGFRSVLGAPTNASLGLISAMDIVISDNEVTPTVGFLAERSTAGIGEDSAEILVGLSNPSMEVVRVQYRVPGITEQGEISFQTGEQMRSFRLDIRNLSPGDELIAVLLSAENGVLGTATIAHLKRERRNTPPLLGSIAAPVFGTAGAPLNLSTEAFDADGDQLECRWDFGDGTSAVGLTPIHIYAVPGKYLVRLTVSDGKAQSESVLLMQIKAAAKSTSYDDDDDGFVDGLEELFDTDPLDPDSRPSIRKIDAPVPIQMKIRSKGHQLRRITLTGTLPESFMKDDFLCFVGSISCSSGLQEKALIIRNGKSNGGDKTSRFILNLPSSICTELLQTLLERGVRGEAIDIIPITILIGDHLYVGQCVLPKSIKVSLIKLKTSGVPYERKSTADIVIK